jgi:hypothetical protein
VQIRVAAGVYTRGNGLPTDRYSAVFLEDKSRYSLTGGWNESFTEQTGRSELEGPSPEERTADSELPDLRLIRVSNGDEITISGFTLRWGSVEGTGGGMHFSADDSSISDLTIEGCSARGDLLSESKGGGLYVVGSGNSIEVTVTGCSAGNGGGLYIAGGDNDLDVLLQHNSAKRGGGAYIASAEGSSLAGEVSGNAAGHGGGVYLAGSSVVITAEVFDNLATDTGIIGDIGARVDGGGVYLAGSSNRLEGAVHGNAAIFESVSLISLASRALGGGVFVGGSDNVIV